MPAPIVPENPVYPATVVTAGGQRLLLEYTDVEVEWDSGENRLKSNKPGWWLINYPLSEVKGLEDPALVFGQETAPKNWYFREAGNAAPEPPEPTGPAPFAPLPDPDLIVDGASESASDENGTAAHR